MPNLIFICLILISFSKNSFALEVDNVLQGYRYQKVAKVVENKGDNKINRVRLRSLSPLANNVILSSEDIVLTGKKSYLFLKLEDDNHLHIASNSVLEIISSKKDNILLLNLIEGSFRARVYDKYSSRKSTNIYIKTKSGLAHFKSGDVLAVQNKKNIRSTFLSLNGVITVTRLNSKYETNVKIDNLEDLIKANAPVTVTRGRFSTLVKNLSTPSIPSKISVNQFNLLLKNITLEHKDPDNIKAPNIYGSSIPLHADARRFANTDVFLNENIRSDYYGKYYPRSKYYKPTAGGYIDLKTAYYIAPPQNSHFDNVTKAFIPPTQYGSFDITTGQYVSPYGFDLNDDGEFKIARDAGSEGAVEFTPKLIEMKDLFLSNVKDGLSSYGNKNLFDEYRDDLQEANLLQSPRNLIKGKTPLNLSITVQ